MFIALNVKYLLYLSDTNNFKIFSASLRNMQQKICIKTDQLAEDLVHADTQTNEKTGIAMVIVRFPIFFRFK
jgi:hypothetical protein